MRTSLHTFRPTLTVAACLAAVLALQACGAGDGRTSAEPYIRSARQHMAAKNSKAAIIELKNALRHDGEQAEARYLLGQALLGTGQGPAAVVELQKAVDLRYDPDLSVPALARALVAQGEASRLIQTLATVELASPAAIADLRTSLANAQVQRGDVAAARSLLAGALQAAPDFAPARLLSARLLALDRRFEEALAELSTVLQHAPGEARAWTLRAEFLQASGAAADRVVADYRKAVSLDPQAAEAHAGLALGLLAQGDSSGAQAALGAMKAALPNHPKTLYLEGAMALQRDDLALARRMSDTLRAQDPAHVDHLRLAGMVALRAGDLRKAEEHFANALQTAGGDSSLRRLLAITQLRAAQPGQAIATLAPLVDRGQVDAEILSLNALALERIGDAKGAEASYGKALRLAAGNPRVREAFAYSRLGRADDAQALAELRTIAAADAGTGTDQVVINALIARRDFAAAARAIEALQRKQPGLPLPAMLSGRLAEAQADRATARAAYERALKLAPAHFPAHAALAALAVREHRIGDARAQFESLLQREPRNVAAMVALAGLQDRTPTGRVQAGRLLEDAIKADPTQAGTRVALIDHHLKAREAKRAVAVAQEGLAAIPDHPILLDALGRASLAAGEGERALTVYRQLSDQQPTAPAPLVSVARAQWALKDPSGANQSLLRALSLRPGFVPAVQGLVDLNLARGRVDAALAQARQLQKLNPADPMGQVLEGQIGSRSKQWDLAAQAFGAALKLAPDRSDIAILLHTALTAAARHDEAQRHAQAWQRRHPKDLLFLMHLGEAAMVRQDWSAAETQFTAVTALDGAFAPALNNLAWVRLQLGKPGAVQAAQQATSLAPDRPEFLDTLALALSAENRAREAMAAEQRAIELQPADPQLWLNLARLSLEAGDKVVARRQLDRLAALGKSFPRQEQVRALQAAL